MIICYPELIPGINEEETAAFNAIPNEDKIGLYISKSACFIENIPTLPLMFTHFIRNSDIITLIRKSPESSTFIVKLMFGKDEVTYLKKDFPEFIPILKPSIDNLDVDENGNPIEVEEEVELQTTELLIEEDFINQHPELFYHFED